MVTTQGKAVGAFTTLALMSRKPMNNFTAYKLFRLKKALAPVVEFQSEQETKLVDELGGSISVTGEILIDDKDKRKVFADKHRELDRMECEVDTQKITMYMKELPEISMSDLEALEEFIEWKE